MSLLLQNKYNINVTEPGFYRFNPLNDTCPSILYQSFTDGIFKKFQDSFFFITLLQFGIVTLMYVNAGKGKYWKILFIASVANLYASLIENLTIAYICRESDVKKPFKTIPTFLVAEIGWIIGEFSIPLLNLTKLKVFSKSRIYKIIKWIIVGVFFPLFALFRFYIGYARMVNGVLQNMDIRLTFAFIYLFVAITDLICTLSILYAVRKNNKRFIETSNVNHYIKHSSYTILILVDIASILLAFFNAITQYRIFGGVKIPESYVNPFQCLKCSFILILAFDSLLFKYGITSSSNGTNTNTCSGSYLNKSRKNQNYNNNYSNNNYSNNNHSGNYNINYNYDFTLKPGMYSSKSIIKNYTNHSTNTLSYSNDKTYNYY